LIYLLDSDVAKKLAQFDLINELTSSLNCQLAQLAILPQLKYQLCLHSQEKALKKLGTKSAVAAINLLILHAREIEIGLDAANPILNLDAPDLDSGEKTLLAALASDEQSSMLTGDKRALIAISKITEPPIIIQLWPRILSLEECIFYIVRSHDFILISKKIRTNPNADNGISMIFGRSEASDYDSVIEGLTSFMSNLHRDTSSLYQLPHGNSSTLHT